LVSFGINDRQHSSHVNVLPISSNTMSHIVTLLFGSSGWTAQIQNKKSLKQLQLLPRVWNQNEHNAYSPGQILAFDGGSSLYFQTDARLRFEHDVIVQYQTLKSEPNNAVSYKNGSIVQYGVGAILAGTHTFVVTVLDQMIITLDQKDSRQVKLVNTEHSGGIVNKCGESGELAGFNTSDLIIFTAGSKIWVADIPMEVTYQLRTWVNINHTTQVSYEAGDTAIYNPED
jgi:hypothetical protein